MIISDLQRNLQNTIIYALPLPKVGVTSASAQRSGGCLQTDSTRTSEVCTKQIVKWNDVDDHRGIHGKHNMTNNPS